MKIELNLSLSQSFRQRHLVAWSLPLLLVSVALLFRLGLSMRTNWSEYRSVRQAVGREEARRNDLAARENALKKQLDLPDNRALLHEVQYVNYLIDQRQLSFSDLTFKVTGLLPPEVRLTGLSLPDASGDPVVRFSVEGTSEGPVETFLSNLEDSPDFRDVTVTSQGFEEKGNGAPVSIGCTARYVGGRAEDALLQLPRVPVKPEPDETRDGKPSGGAKASKAAPSPRGASAADKIKAGASAHPKQK